MAELCSSAREASATALRQQADCSTSAAAAPADAGGALPSATTPSNTFLHCNVPRTLLRPGAPVPEKWDDVLDDPVFAAMFKSVHGHGHAARNPSTVEALGEVERCGRTRHAPPPRTLPAACAVVAGAEQSPEQPREQRRGSGLRSRAPLPARPATQAPQGGGACVGAGGRREEAAQHCDRHEEGRRARGEEVEEEVEVELPRQQVYGGPHHHAAASSASSSTAPPSPSSPCPTPRQERRTGGRAAARPWARQAQADAHHQALVLSLMHEAVDATAAQRGGETDGEPDDDEEEDDDVDDKEHASDEEDEDGDWQPRIHVTTRTWLGPAVRPRAYVGTAGNVFGHWSKTPYG
ncbi:hypothetical protein FOA52_013756 [Chlamydomonas sp. UWO 241]|nr:hypothetical protein FOA52_013756 [Chlamydomonas sp. UWO 241]